MGLSGYSDAANLGMTATTPSLSGALSSRERLAAIEWPTVTLIFATYGGWLAITASYAHWPLIIVAPFAVILITLHGSLQHEIIHGHPTRSALANRLLVVIPLSLWLPFARYRRSHLAHHIDERLTDPLDDPESYYWTADSWARLGPLSRTILRVQQTLAGRIFIGSFWRIKMFLTRESRAVWHNAPHARRDWFEHLLWCVPVVFWIKAVCGIPLWLYFIAMVIPANALQLIRAFAEHRAVTAVRGRIAIVERSWILGPLFLFNNLHALHHEAPMIPWYRYNAHYRRERTRLIAENGALVYSTYLDVASRFLFRAHDSPLHPTGRIPPRQIQAGSA
jgi:fatty acid desaturase